MSDIDQETPPPLQRSMQSGNRDYEAAVEQVIALAEHTLHIFDPNLSRGGFGSQARFDALNRFLRKSAKNRLVIVLHDTDYFTAYCPRLKNLLKTHSHAVAIHKTLDYARVANDPIVIADEAHYVHRFHRDGMRFLLALHDPTQARQLDERFRQLLEASHPAVFATTLGL